MKLKRENKYIGIISNKVLKRVIPLTVAALMTFTACSNDTYNDNFYQINGFYYEIDSNEKKLSNVIGISALSNVNVYVFRDTNNDIKTFFGICDYRFYYYRCIVTIFNIENGDIINKDTYLNCEFRDNYNKETDNNNYIKEYFNQNFGYELITTEQFVARVKEKYGQKSFYFADEIIAVLNETRESFEKENSINNNFIKIKK